MDRKARLAALLGDYRTDDPPERTFRASMLELLATPGDPFDRNRFDPGHFTASGFVLSPAGDRLLMIHHARLERWLQPGGHIEASDEDVELASAREVLEETGITVAGSRPGPMFDLDIHAIPARPGAPEHQHFDLRFLWRADEGAAVKSAESLEVAWVPLDDLEARFDSPSMARVTRKLAALGRTP